MTQHRQFLIIVLFLYTFAGLHAQNRITIQVEPFEALSVSGRIDLELVPSDTKEMSITARKGNQEDVDVDYKNGELRIKAKPNLDKENEYQIKLPYKHLIKIEAGAGAVINSRKELHSNDLELKALSGGKIELTLKTKNIDAHVSQVSDIILYGEAETQNVKANTGGNYLAYDLECNDSYVKASAGAQAKVIARRIIEATANSKGFVGYIGDPVSTYTKTSLGGEIASFKTKKDTEVY